MKNWLMWRWDVIYTHTMENVNEVIVEMCLLYRMRRAWIWECLWLRLPTQIQFACSTILWHYASLGLFCFISYTHNHIDTQTFIRLFTVTYPSRNPDSICTYAVQSVGKECSLFTRSNNFQAHTHAKQFHIESHKYHFRMCACARLCCLPFILCLVNDVTLHET